MLTTHTSKRERAFLPGLMYFRKREMIQVQPHEPSRKPESKEVRWMAWVADAESQLAPSDHVLR